MKTAIFWGVENNCYEQFGIICDSESLDEAVAKIIEDYICSAGPPLEGHILGGWDPFLFIEGEDVDKIDIKTVCNSDKYDTVDTLYWFCYYSPVRKTFEIPVHEDKFVEYTETMNVCTGWGENVQKRVSFRLETGILNPLFNLTKRQRNQFVQGKLISYVLKNFFKPGKFWEYLQKKYNINMFIIPSPNHIIILGDHFVGGCDNLPKINLKKEGKIKMATYRIDKGLVFALKKLSEEQNRTLTDVFKSALIS